MAELLPVDAGPAGGFGARTAATAEVLVVGAGLSGARLCQRLRAEGFTGRLVLVGAEPDLPYDRPPLTSEPGVDTDLARTMGIDVRGLADEVHLGRHAVALARTQSGTGDPRWVVTFAGRSTNTVELEAAVVVAATGASPLLPLGWQVTGLLHTRRQADAFWQRVVGGTRLVVVGGGWIGCEVARTAAARGAQVHVLEAADRLPPGRMPGGAAVRVAGLLEAAGVIVHLGTRVTGVVQDAGRTQVRTTDATITGDVVLAALGVRPETAWLPDQVRRSTTGAVLTDQWGRGSLPGVFALGDAAARWSPRAGVHLPGGHWTEAFGCAESVAPAVISWLSDRPSAQRWADPLPTPTNDPIPYIFSDLGEHRLLVLGDATVRGQQVWREQEAGWTLYLLDEVGRLAGVVALDRPRDVVAARKAMRTAPSGRPEVDVTALTDPTAGPARTFPVAAMPQRSKSP